jgi:hypothetical protein
VQALAFVARRHLGKLVGRLEAELMDKTDIHGGRSIGANAGKRMRAVGRSPRLPR